MRRLAVGSVITAAVAAALLSLTGTRPGGTRATDACGPARPHVSGDATETIASGSHDRRYIIYTPSSYDGREQVPLVLNFHGLGSSGQEQADYSELRAKARQEGFILVMPQGTHTSFIPPRHWNFTTLEVFEDTPNDVEFVSDLLDSLEARFCVDHARVYATGMSNGAQMSTRLACDLSERFAAVAPVSGVYYPPAFMQLSGEPGCEDPPVPIIAFHGTDDGIIKFEGGPLGISLPFDTRHIERAVLPDWAAHNECDVPPQHEEVTEHVRLVRYAGCSADVELFVMEGGLHEWPGASSGLGVPESDEISANDLMWEFFESHALVERDPVTPATQSGAPVVLLDTGASDDGNWTSLLTAGVAAATVCAAVGLLLWRRWSVR